MRIAISATGPTLDAEVDPRFGRCQYFIVVDPETMEFEAIGNPNIAATGGAGIQSAQLVVNKGAEVVLTGNVGPNAFQTLQAAGIKIVTGITGSVKDAVEKYKKGEITPATDATVPGHFGMGMGGGMGMGRGRGMGRGMGMGQQQPMGLPPQPPQAPQIGKENELQMLEDQTQMLKQQMDQIQKRIAELSKKKKKKKK